MTKTRTLSIDEIHRLVLGANDPGLSRYFTIYLMSAERADAVLQLPWQARGARGKSHRGARPRRDRDVL